MAESSSKRIENTEGKEKLLVTGNFSFSYSIFNKLEQQTRKIQGLFGNGLKKKPSKNIVGKRRKCYPKSSVVVCKCYQFRQFLNFIGNPFPNKPLFLRVCRTSLLKTLWEREKLLVTSNFSSSYSVFYPFGGLPAIFIKFKIVVC